MVSAFLAQRLTPIVNMTTSQGVIKFFCPGEIPLWRAETLLTKEPETIEWIDGFKGESVLWDIGANVGVYSLYAALKPHVRVLAFEPSSSNYYVLNSNIRINQMGKKIQALCIAFNNETKLDYLYKASTEIGGSGRFFAETTDAVGQEFATIFTQGMIGFSIDDFIRLFNPPFPNHIKIDVDGIENKLIQGASKTLADNRLKSILIELNSDRVEYCQEVVSNLERGGLKLLAKYPINHIYVRD